MTNVCIDILFTFCLLFFQFKHFSRVNFIWKYGRTVQDNASEMSYSQIAENVHVKGWLEQEAILGAHSFNPLIKN